MGTILASAIITKVQAELRDDTTFFSSSFLLDGLNQAQRAIVLIKPSANTVSASVILVEGIEQSIPSTGSQLINVTYNRGTDGTTLGKDIKLISKDKLDAINPTWRSDTPSATVECYMFDPEHPTKFDVYPAQPSSGFGYVWMVYSKPASDIALTSNVISLDDIYETPLTQYLHYKSRLKDRQFKDALNMYNAFLSSLGQKAMAEKEFDPDKVL